MADLGRTRIQAARAEAIRAAPYFGTALSAMVLHEVPGLGTFATDRRWRMYYDPAVVAGWSLGSCVAAWLHEVKHQLHDHGGRFEALGEPPDGHLLFNLAADALINEDLRDMEGSGAVELGADWVFLETLPVEADRSMTAEQIYRKLASRAAQGCPAHDAVGGDAGPRAGADEAGAEVCTCGGAAPDPRGAGDCGSGAGSGRIDRWWELPGSDGSDGSVDEGRGELIGYDAARQVVAHAKLHGRDTMPAGTMLWAEAIVDPAVDWRAELRSVVSNRCAAVAGRRDYTYSRPSRRKSSERVILPGLLAPAPPRGAVVLDTSASMSIQEREQGVAEVAGILRHASRGRSELHVISCDAAAAQAQVVRNSADVRLVGGGGTDMRVGIEAAADLRPRVDFVVVFTDGYTPWPAAPPEQNRGARYIAVLSDGPVEGVPDWFHTIVVDADSG